MDKDGDPIPLKRERRLRSLDEFARPWWYPKFELPMQQSQGIGAILMVMVGLLLGAAIGLFLIV